MGWRSSANAAAMATANRMITIMTSILWQREMGDSGSGRPDYGRVVLHSESRGPRERIVTVR
jgi:hypothetical protein